MFNIRPVSVGECVQFATAVQFAGAPELNDRVASQCVGSVGPAGMLLADDTEMYERNRLGLEPLKPEWLDIRRGRNRKRLDKNGFTVGGATDETAMRAFLVAAQDLDGAAMIGTTEQSGASGAVPDRAEVEQFLYVEASYADEADYDGWEALWTDDALYWVPVASTDDPRQQMSVIYHNRSRITTRLNQLRTGKRYAQAPKSSLRRLLSNIELLGGMTNPDGGTDLQVGANFLVVGSRARGTHLWGPRVTYRLRRIDGALRLAHKRADLVDNDRPIPTLGFLI